MGSLKNGDLIDEAVRRGYDLLVTADRRMRKQQEIRGKPIRVVVLTRPDRLKAQTRSGKYGKPSRQQNLENSRG